MVEAPQVNTLGKFGCLCATSWNDEMKKWSEQHRQRSRRQARKIKQHGFSRVLLLVFFFISCDVIISSEHPQLLPAAPHTASQEQKLRSEKSSESTEDFLGVPTSRELWKGAIPEHFLSGLLSFNLDIDGAINICRSTELASEVVKKPSVPFSNGEKVDKWDTLCWFLMSN